MVDSHAHLGTFGSFDLRLETLLGYIERSGVRLALVSNLDGSSAQATRQLGSTAANQVTLETVRRHPGRLRGLLWANPPTLPPPTSSPSWPRRSTAIRPVNEPSSA